MGFEDSRAYFNKFFGPHPRRLQRPRPHQPPAGRPSPGPSFSLNAERGLVRQRAQGRELEGSPPASCRSGAASSRPSSSSAQAPFSATLNSQYDQLLARPRLSACSARTCGLAFTIRSGCRPISRSSPRPGCGKPCGTSTRPMRPTPGPDDQYFHRELYDARLALFTNFSRSYDVDQETLKKVRHAVRPELSYTYVPDVDQEDLPHHRHQGPHHKPHAASPIP
ncbi:MAG: LPS-assembly protein LptD [Desulfobacterales bacterium]|nr:LPS-assembly protein LptD [Desulfobacterales bacterium]